MVEYLKDVHGFEPQNITILLDDGQHTNPTHDNILNAYRRLVAESQPGDAVYCHYSGHGGKLRDDDGDEKDGYDETLVPLDYQSKGQIRDDDLFNTLVGPMKKGVQLTCIMDCCHSGKSASSGVVGPYYMISLPKRVLELPDVLSNMQH